MLVTSFLGLQTLCVTRVSCVLSASHSLVLPRSNLTHVSVSVQTAATAQSSDCISTGDATFSATYSRYRCRFRTISYHSEIMNDISATIRVQLHFLYDIISTFVIHSKSISESLWPKTRCLDVYPGAEDTIG